MITETTLIIRSYFFEKYFSWQDNLRLEIRAPEEKKIVPINGQIEEILVW